MNKYDICVWDIQFCKKDDDGNELLNSDGSVKLFRVAVDIDLSDISEYLEHEDLEEIEEEA